MLHPLTQLNIDIDINSPGSFIELPQQDRVTLCRWILENIKPQSRMNKRHTSYGLKHKFEHDKANGGRYVTNGMFKGGMLLCGFEPDNEDDLNWCFRISEKSPAFRRDV